MKVRQLITHLAKLNPEAEILPTWDMHIPGDFGGLMRAAAAEADKHAPGRELILLDCEPYGLDGAAWDLPGTVVVRAELHDADGLVSASDHTDEHGNWALALPRRPSADWHVVAVYDDGHLEPVYFVPKPELTSAHTTLWVDLRSFRGRRHG